MTAGWVAGSVRGRGLCRRRLGRVGARRVAATGVLDEAVAEVARSPYGRNVLPGMPLAEAARAVAAVCLWHLRVLAGWLPTRAADAARVFAAPFEIANIGDRLAALDGGSAPLPHQLGALAVAWPRVAVAASAAEVRAVLASSAWGDPGSSDWHEVEAALEARWSSWVAAAGQSVWAAGWAGLVAARSIGTPALLLPGARADLRRVIGSGWESVDHVEHLGVALPTSAAWVVSELDHPEDLWRAEGTWWRRVDDDAATILHHGQAGPAVALAAAARLVVDARRVRSALEAAAWGQPGLEAFDAFV